jgi:UDP-N-acetylmuramoyl-tripeptide--D-alanyl-D-alanine ligase
MHQPLHVDFSMPLAKAAAVMKGQLTGTGEMSGVALDTRALQKGDLFFALESLRDGHDFVKDAFQKGACAAVVHRQMTQDRPLIQVENTLKALWDFANSVRRSWGRKVVAIGGSNGKSTTKQMTGAVLNAYVPTHVTPGTWNNHLGVPLTLLLLSQKHHTAVLELGINDFGEMKALANIAEPDVGVLTNIGPEHLEKFKSVEGVKRAEGELFEALRPEGTAVVNLDDSNIKSLSETCRAKKITISLKEKADLSARVLKDLGPQGLVLSVKYGEQNVEIRTPFLGTHNIYNLLCAFGAAYAIGAPASSLQAGVDAIQPMEMRLQIENLPRNVRMVVDCYNANPASTLVALEVTKGLARGRAMAVLGDMLELGDISARAHRDIGKKAAELGFDYVVCLGRFATDIVQGAVQGGMTKDSIRIASSHDDAAHAIIEKMTDGDTLLLKGSRGMKLEKVGEKITALIAGGKA